MKKMKAFFYVFYKSLTSFEYYKDILDTPFSFSIKYLAMLALLATIFTTISTSIVEMPKITTWAYEQKANFINLYPDELEVTAIDGEWSINRPEPYEIKAPEYMHNNEGSMPKNLVVLDKSGTINDFESKDTLVLVNKNNMLVKSETKYEVYPLENLPNGTLTKQNFESTVNQIDGLMQYLPFVFVTITGIFLFFYFFVWRMVYLLIVASALFMVNMIVKPDVDFKHLYRIGLHAMTVPLLIDMGLRVFNIQMFVMLPWFFIINVVLGGLVIIRAAKISE